MYINISVPTLTGGTFTFIFQVDCSKTGPGVIVERFAGDGSGLTSRKNIDWQLNEDITFYVKGQYDGVCNI